MAKFVKVASTDELEPGQCKTVRANGRIIALYNVDGTFYATDDTCSHNGGPLGEGTLEGTTITCPWHYWQYEVTTGKMKANASTRIDTYAVRVDGTDVLVDVE